MILGLLLSSKSVILSSTQAHHLNKGDFFIFFVSDDQETRPR